jgi:hypothetical protein
MGLLAADVLWIYLRRICEYWLIGDFKLDPSKGAPATQKGQQKAANPFILIFS